MLVLPPTTELNQRSEAEMDTVLWWMLVTQPHLGYYCVSQLLAALRELLLEYSIPCQFLAFIKFSIVAKTRSICSCCELIVLYILSSSSLLLCWKASITEFIMPVQSIFTGGVFEPVSNGIITFWL